MIKAEQIFTVAMVELDNQFALGHWPIIWKPHVDSPSHWGNIYKSILFVIRHTWNLLLQPLSTARPPPPPHKMLFVPQGSENGIRVTIIYSSRGQYFPDMSEMFGMRYVVAYFSKTYANEVKRLLPTHTKKNVPAWRYSVVRTYLRWKEM